MRLAGIATITLLLMAARPALACSVNDDYRVPTNLELATKADVIMLARVESGTTSIEGLDMMMTVTPLALLKGQVPLGKPLTLPGAIAEPRFAVLSNPLQLDDAHPLAYIGGCTRYMFVRGATVLFFLTPAEKLLGADVPNELRGKLMPAGGAFSRWAEDVLSDRSPWVRATEIYVAAGPLPSDQQRAMLVAERDKLRATGDQESKVIADDIDRQLLGPNKPWNQRMEEEIAKMKARGEDPTKDLDEAIDDAADALEAAAAEQRKKKR